MNTDKIYAEQIANEYAPKKASKVKALRRLDDKVKNPPLILALVLGIVFSLIFGTGMSLVMKVIGDGSIASFVLGIGLGLVGIFGACINYFIYKFYLAKNKLKYGADILALAEEITQELD